MTSIMDTDEEALEAEGVIEAEGPIEADSIDVDEDATDVQSLYPASHYPSAPTAYRTEMPFVPDDHEMNTQEDAAASTRSLWARDLDYREIHGRLYCRDWFMPIDEVEQLRGSLNHQVFLNVLGGEHTTVPLDDPTHILDVGTGTGDWAIKLAELYPDCEVVGTDIAAIAETQSVPMNVFFEIEDAEDWDRLPDHYDLIHFRSMEGAFRDWKLIYDNVFYSLKPGGYIELQDFDTTVGLDQFTGGFSEGSPIHNLFNDLAKAAARSGRPRGNAHMNANLFMEAGFVDVKVTEYMIPFSTAEQSAGKIWLISCLDALEALCLRLLTEQMGWDPEKCKIACENAAREMANLARDPRKSNGMGVKIVVISGRKPRDSPLSPPQLRQIKPLDIEAESSC